MVTTPNYDLDIDTTLGGNNASDFVIPSQKAIKDYVDNHSGGAPAWGNITGTLADQTDLANALDIKLNNSQISNCILEAPNGVATYSGGTVTVKSGLRVLIPNGRNSDGTLNNIDLTLPQDIVATLGASEFSKYFILNETGTISFWGGQYIESPTSPDIGNYALWYNPVENKVYFSDSTGGNWQQSKSALLGFCVASPGTITELTAFQTVNLLKNTDNITGMSHPYLAGWHTYLFNTEYTIPQDGWLFCQSSLWAGRNRDYPGDGVARVAVTVDGVGLYINKVQCSWDGSGNTVVVRNTITDFFRVYAGQKVKMYTAELTNFAGIDDTLMYLYPMKHWR